MRNKPYILFRDWRQKEYEDERICASKYFSVVSLRSECKGHFQTNNSLVAGRYSVLPYYKEVSDDLLNNGCYLINSPEQYNFIASFEYYEKVKEFTFPTWKQNEFIYAPEQRYIVKGTTNSKKFDWSKLMFAGSKKRAIEISCELKKDSLIGEQDIIFRQYIPLKTYEIGINELPFTNEWRFFYYKNNLLSYGYYWSIAENKSDKIDNKMVSFANGIAEIIKDHVDFFTLDVAEKENGGYILVEINDGQMSGLSDNNPEILYENLSKNIQ